MDHQTLDRLLTDRAVGELGDDAAELLADYLAEHPELQERAGAIDETVQLAERAFQRYGMRELPPLDRHRIEKARRWSRRSNLRRQVLTVAAAFLVGASAVLMTRPAERLIPDRGGPTARGSVPLVAYPSAQPISEESFWSLERVAATGQVRSTARHAHPAGEARQAIEATFWQRR
jgi:anti-sigma factor RsiW